MDSLYATIREIVEEIYPELVRLRHVIHANPELSNQEYETARLVEKTLASWGIHSVRVPGSTAVIAQIQGDLPGKNSIGVRADMDALPIQEETGLDYGSQRMGVMHACGHDIHTVNLVGTAFVLSRLKGSFGGTVKLVFQPAEETGGGAQEILDFGILDNPPVTAFLAAHVSEDLSVGKVQVKAEEVMLASSQFTINIRGKGGHAAAPYLTEDIILTGAKLIVELQSITTRKINHFEPVVITVGSIHGGERGNIIPKELTIIGTIRTQNSALHEEIHTHICSIARGLEIISGAKIEISFRLGSGAVYNDPELTDIFREAATGSLGAENVVLAKYPNNGSENFYRFAKAVPSVFFRLGVKDKYAEKVEPAHSSKFQASDEALETGVKVTTAAVLAFLRRGG